MNSIALPDRASGSSARAPSRQGLDSPVALGARPHQIFGLGFIPETSTGSPTVDGVAYHVMIETAEAGDMVRLVFASPHETEEGAKRKAAELAREGHKTQVCLVEFTVLHTFDSAPRKRGLLNRLLTNG